MAGLLIKLGALTDRMTEVPLRVRYDLKEGGSGLPIIRTFFGYVKLLAKNWHQQVPRGTRSSPRSSQNSVT